MLDESQQTSQSSASTAESKGSYYDDDGKEIFPNKSSVPLKRKIEILKLVNDHPNWSLDTIRRNGCSEFIDKKYKARWQAQVDSGGTNFDKYQAIDDYTWDMFNEADRKSVV